MTSEDAACGNSYTKCITDGPTHYQILGPAMFYWTAGKYSALLTPSVTKRQPHRLLLTPRPHEPSIRRLETGTRSGFQGA